MSKTPGNQGAANGITNGIANGITDGITGAAMSWQNVMPFDGNLEESARYFPMLTNDTEKAGFYKNWWSPELKAQLVLADFALLPWRDEGPATRDFQAKLASEVGDLLELREQRPARAGEILAQSISFSDVWYHFLMIENGRRPMTAALVQIGIAVGELVGIYWKDVFNRPPPSPGLSGTFPGYCNARPSILSQQPFAAIASGGSLRSRGTSAGGSKGIHCQPVK